MKIYNGLPYPISLFRKESVFFDVSLHRYMVDDCAQPIITLSPGDIELKITAKKIPIKSNIKSLPLFKNDIEYVAAMPLGYDIYIVPLMYAEVVKRCVNGKFAILDDIVYMDSGKCKYHDKIVGCLRLLIL